MGRDRIRSWHADRPEPGRRGGHDWQTLVASLHQAGDRSAADALDVIMRTADALRGRARHWADTVLEGRGSGSWTSIGRGRQAGDLPYAVECALALQDSAARLQQLACDYGYCACQREGRRCGDVQKTHERRLLEIAYEDEQ